MIYLQQFLFGYYPYIAMAFFFIGSAMRFNYAQYGWKSGSSQLLSSRGMRLGSNCFHIGILLLFAGHFVGLLTPEAVYAHFIAPQTKQFAAMIAGGLFGSLCFVGITILVYRRLFNPRVRATSGKMDIFILLLLYLQLILGLLTIPVSYHHASGGKTMEALALWAQHIAYFRPGAAQFILAEPLIFKFHIVIGLTIFLVFPFTRLVHIWSAPVLYLKRIGYQIARRG
ncbi:MAG: respiratory nitrate reductase subunit gamma [Gammaproteobacteria bacterium]|nr:respiratory nitrate reductase subunit gamma [Gammaproteobacteria bacterium]